MVVLVTIFTALHSNWQRANVRCKLGWLNWLFEDAELHRWLHSLIIRHSTSNYGNNLVVFDILFGTRCLPKVFQDINEFALDDHDVAYQQSWWEQSLLPFRWRSILKIASNEKT